VHLADGNPPPEPVRNIRADALARADTAWRIRVAGGTWAQAAQVAGFTDEHNASRAVSSVFGELPKQDRTELRRLWRDRLETMWRQVQIDMHEQRHGAVTAAVRIAQVAAALDGLNEPTRVDIEVQALDALSAELAAYGL
jgi:hypothetical protein